MLNEIKNLNRSFSDVELELIEEFTNIHKGTLRKEIKNSREYYLMSSEITNARFSINKVDNVRSIQIVINSFGNNDRYDCFNPMLLKKHLGI